MAREGTVRKARYGRLFFGRMLALLALTSFWCSTQAQDFSRIPPTQVYQANTQGYPIFEDGDTGCALIGDRANAGNIQSGTSSWYEYKNPKFLIHPVYGQGCQYDLVQHGTNGGYPEGHVLENWFGQNLVDVKEVCPAGYTESTTYNPDGSRLKLCLRGTFVVSQPCAPCEADKTFGNPVSAVTGRKTELVIDAAFGDAIISRTFRSGTRWYVYGLPIAFGHGWHSLASTRISYIPATAYSSAAVYALRPDGTVIPFLTAAGVWTTETNLAANALKELRDVNDVRTGWKFTTPEGIDEFYNADGELIATERAGVLQMEFRRDTSGRLQELADRHGRTATVRYNVQQQIDQIVLPDGATLAYGYDAANRLISVSTAGGTKQYEYFDVAGVDGVHLAKVIDENNVVFAEFGYDTSGNANRTSHAGGVDAFDLTYRNNGNEVDVITPSGGSETLSFDLAKGSRRLRSSALTCPGCSTAPETRTYDANGYPDVLTDRKNTTLDRDFNARGLEARRVEAANDSAGMKRTTQTDWHASFRVPTERRTYNAANALVAKTAWTYNTRGQALNQSQTDPGTSATRTTSTTYCEQADIDAGTCPLLGLTTSIDGPRTDVTDVTTFTYRMADEASCATSPTTCPYRKGDLWKVTNALGHITETLKYDGAGRVLSVKDANAVVTDMEYHPRGWLTARKVRGANLVGEASDQITRVEYWPTGLVKKVTQPDGAFTSYTYDAAHRLTDITDASGNSLHYTLDNAGNKTKEDTTDAQGALKRTLSRVYNQLGQLQTQKDASQHPTGFVYDPNGNVDTVTDALTRVTDNDYDPLNRLQRTLQDVGGINAETRFAYDALDNLTKVTDPKGLDTNYVYNGLGDLTQLGSPDTGITHYTYDSAGNRKTQVDARATTATYSYDTLNRLIGIVYPTTSLNVVYTYDASQAVCASGETFSTGRLTKLADSSGTTQYCFDRFGNLVRKVQVSNGMTFTLRYTYTLGGQISSLTYPNNLLVDYVRDGQGRVSQVGVTPSGSARQVLLTGAAYAPFGPVTGWTYGNGRTMQRTLNQNYQPATIDGGAGGLSLGYGFDAVGNLTTLRTAQQADPPLATYGYDRLNRLGDVMDGATGTPIEHYDYDATGNRLSLTAAGSTTAYTYPAGNHRLTQVGTVARSYDATGNTTQIGGTARQFVYNDAGRMSQVKAGAAVTMNYLYNGKGEQVRKSLGTANTYTLFDEAGHWLGDYDTVGAPTQQAIWLDDLPVGVMVGATTSQKLHYVEPDHLGTPRVVIDPVRNIAVWKWELKGEAFGATVPNQNPDNDANTFVFNMRFAGQRYDAASGLNYNLNREYEKETGRYTQADPIGLKGGLATFAYADGMPTQSIDPTGLAPSLAPYDPNRNTTCCVDGQLTLCMMHPGNSRYRCEFIQESMRVHERVHVEEIRRKNPSICAGTKGRYSLGFNNLREAQTSELNAFKAQLDYLSDQLRRPRCFTPECLGEANEWIDYIRNQAIPSVLNGSYNNPNR